MSDTLAATGYGSTFGIGDGSNPPVYAVLTELVALKALKLKADQIEVTHLISQDGYREDIAGLKDFDAISGTVNFVPGSADEIALLAVFESAAKTPFQIVFPNGATWQFTGFMTDYSPGDLDAAKKMEASFIVMPSGAPAITATGMLIYKNPLNLALGIAAGLL